MQVAQSRAQDWIYLSEGGSTIVFAYAGPPHPHFTDKVLRLRKILHSRKQDAFHRIDEEDDPAIAFQNTVIASLVPVEFLPDLHVALLDAKWLTELETLRDGDRPPERRANDGIDTARQKGVLATDLVGGADVLAIEIKPKWGFMPNPAHLSPETAKTKRSTCRFCMHTRFKSRDCDLPTQYCPLDLYSQDDARVRKAVRDLWNGWVQSDGALNNMRVFVSGKMIRPSESYSSLEEFLSTKTDVDEALAIAMLPLLRTTPVLRTIANLQRSLDALDIEGIAKLHAMTCPDANGLMVARGDPSLEEWQDFVASYHSVYCALDHSRPCPESMDTYLAAYLLSATFKDCSVILRVHRSDLSRSGIFIIDLDLKGTNRFQDWAHLDRRIVEYYRDAAQRKVCTE